MLILQLLFTLILSASIAETGHSKSWLSDEVNIPVLCGHAAFALNWLPSKFVACTMVLTDETFLAFTLVAFVVALLSLLALFLKILSGARRSPLALGLLPILCAAAFQLIFVSGPHYVENRICHARAPLPERYEALVGSVVPVPRDFAAADLHSDALMWMRRDLLSRGTAGHVDLPRLEEGRFKLQVFSMVISAPRGINLQSNMRPHFLLEDHVFPKMILERWPIRSWNSHLQRALVQCERLHKLSTDSAGRLLVALTATDVDRPGIQGVLALEGATSLESNVQNLDLLYKAGLRVLGPTHFFDTEGKLRVYDPR